MRISTHDDITAAIDRLKMRDSVALAAFIVSLAQDDGPVGEQVRTFIVGDDVDETAADLRERLKSLEGASEYAHRHALGREIGAHLAFILDSIEMLVLPVDKTKAFELLVAFFKADSVAMENCGEHHWEVQCAFERAAGLMAQAAKSVPRAQMTAALEALMENDGYGVRVGLSKVLVGGDDEA